MDKKKPKIKIKGIVKEWGLPQVLDDLKMRGATEITPKMRKKQPYRTYMKNIKKNGKFVCE